MADQLIGDASPGPRDYRASSALPHSGEFYRIAAHRGDLGGEQFGILAAPEPAVVAMAHEVKGATGCHGDHRNTRAQRFLNDLAKRLVGPGMYEHVQRRHHAGQVGTGELAGEERTRHEPFEWMPTWAVTDDHKADTCHAGQWLEQFNPFLGSEPADAADK